MKSEQVITKTKKVPRIKKSGIIIFCILILIAAGAYYFFTSTKSTNTTSKAILRTATAENQDLSTTITGSGSLVSANQASISAKTSGTIRTLSIKQGDKVKAGQVICTLDTTDALTNVQNAKSNLEQAQYSQNTNLENLKNLTVKAGISGQVTSINVNEGDIVQNNSVLLTIIDTKKMKIIVPFNGSNINGIKVGSPAVVNLSSSMESINGKVTYISNSPYSTSDGGELYNVEISFNNPGSLSEAMKASADINVGNITVSSTDVGTLTYTDKTTVRTTTGGTVKKINAKLYDRITKGEVILTLENTEVTNTVQSNIIKIASLKQQVDNSIKQLSYCNMVAPISGTITSVKNKEGDTLKLGDVLTSITDINHMQFTIPVDELDIAKVKVDQSVDISVDALTATATLPLVGKITQIAVEGSPSNGVTTYDVTIGVTGVTDPRTLFGSFNRSGNGNNSTQASTNSTNTPRRTVSETSTNSNVTDQRQGAAGPQNMAVTGNEGQVSGQNRSSNRGFAQLDTSTLLTSLKDGMNASATVYINKNKGALSIPLEAITSISGRNYVMVNSDAATVEALKKSGKYIDLFSTTTSTTNSSEPQSSNGTNSSGSNRRSSGMSSGRNTLIANKEYYKNAIPTVVEVGVNTSTYIQITSGLNANDVVILPPLVASAKSNTSATGGSGLGGLFGGGGGGNFGGGQNRPAVNNARSNTDGTNSVRSGGGN